LATQPQPAQMRDLDSALQDLTEEYCTRVHEHVEVTVRSVEYPHCVVTRTYHPRDCRCEPDEPGHAEPVSNMWLRLFESEKDAGL